MAKFRIERIEDFSIWDSFVENSEEGTIFSDSHYLTHCGRTFENVGFFKGDHIKAGLSMILNDAGTGCELDDLVIYGGLMFVQDPVHKSVKVQAERFSIMNEAITYLVNRFDYIALALSPAVIDVRPFLWHNYHSQNRDEKFSVDLRYTSYLDITSLQEDRDEEESVNFKNLDTLRQRNIREARKEKAYVKLEFDASVFKQFYEEALFSQGHDVCTLKSKRMLQLIQALIKKKKAVAFTAYNSKQKVMYITVFCFDHKRAYYLFGAGNPDMQERYKGTICFWEALRALAQQNGITEIDFEGVNSPKRGAFKLSFGGDLRTYFEIHRGH